MQGPDIPELLPKPTTSWCFERADPGWTPTLHHTCTLVRAASAACKSCVPSGAACVCFMPACALQTPCARRGSTLQLVRVVALLQHDPSARSVRVCGNETKHLADITDTGPGRAQQPSQQRAEPSPDACSCAEECAQAALSAARAPRCLTPQAAEQGLLLRSATLSPLSEEAHQAPAATSGLQDMPCLLPPPAPYAAGLTVPPQQLPRPTNAFRAVPSVSAAAGVQQSGAEQQPGELPAHSLRPEVQKPGPTPKARQAVAGTGSPSSCMSAAAPRDELRPEDEYVVCLDARRCVTVAHCGHWPYCIECAERLCGPKGIHALTRGEVCSLCQEAVYATVSKTFY